MIQATDAHRSARREGELFPRLQFVDQPRHDGVIAPSAIRFAPQDYRWRLRSETMRAQREVTHGPDAREHDARTMALWTVGGYVRH